jgi:hypothetical protein
MRVITPAASAPLVVVLALAWAAAAGRVAAKNPPYEPHIDPADFRATVDNPYLPLVPGTTFKLVEKLGNHTSENDVTVTADTKVIMGVTCVVVHDVVREKGVIKEDTYDWYAQDMQGNVWYFGEDTTEFHGDKFSTEGSWKAGVGKNRPGIVMPSKPVPGAPYRQEYGPGIAEDMGQVVAVNDSVTVPYGSFGGCVRTKEWSLLESGTDKKWYARDVGFVREEAADKSVVTLVSVTRP